MCWTPDREARVCVVAEVPVSVVFLMAFFEQNTLLSPQYISQWPPSSISDKMLEGITCNSVD